MVHFDFDKLSTWGKNFTNLTPAVISLTKTAEENK